jgi:hypothetical protein
MKKTGKRSELLAGACAVILLTGLIVLVAMVRPSATKAASTLADMPTFVYPPVTLRGDQSLVICGSDMGEVAISGQIGLLDVGDTTQNLVKISFTLQPNTGSCTPLPAVQQFGFRETRNSVIAYVAFLPTTTWNSTSGKAYVGSLQVMDGQGVRVALAPMFLPAVPIPQ